MLNSKLTNLLGWMVAVAATALYMLTLEPTVSFWDCGEFIATSHTLQIGHPPGAPLYTLLAHCFTLLAGTPQRVAWWSNALSAVAGGLTAMFLFWIIVRLLQRVDIRSKEKGLPVEGDISIATYLAALTGTACYVFCDTAWFSACESEVYSLSMLFSAAIIWSMLRWSDHREPRWLLLTAMLMGLSVGVHMLSLLTIPAIILIIIFENNKKKASGAIKSNPLRGNFKAEPAPLRGKIMTVLYAVLFFAIGLSPYLVIPIRAAANPPINMGDPSTAKAFHDYLTREQYEHAPLIYGRCFNSPVVDYRDGKPVYAKEMNMIFPRMWKHHENAELYYSDWTGRHGKMVDVDGRLYYKPSFLDNLALFGGYQLGYMYLRYLMWNFGGRYDDQQGFGNLQKGQFITGIPFIDRLYIGTGKTPPPSMHNAGHNRYFLLPFLLGIVGIFAHFKRNKKGAWVTMSLFLMSSLMLSLYLNHPVYEPRERDYAYILSFFAFAIWIALGTFAIADKCSTKIASLIHRRPGKKLSTFNFQLSTLFLAVPLLMACQNWDDHNRSRRFLARDSAANLLNSCSENAILFTLGDNDTFPLWYLQQVEEFRNDVTIINLSLLGSDSYCQSICEHNPSIGVSFDDLANMGPHSRMNMIIGMNYRHSDETTTNKEIFFSRYAQVSKKGSFPNRLQLCGIAYRLGEPSLDSVDTQRSLQLMSDKLHWSSLQDVYADETCRSFLRQYWNDVLQVADNLVADSLNAEAISLLDKTSGEIPATVLKDLTIRHHIAMTYLAAGDMASYTAIIDKLRSDLAEQLAYYNTMSPAMQQFIPYSLQPLIQLASTIKIQ